MLRRLLPVPALASLAQATDAYRLRAGWSSLAERGRLVLDAVGAR